MPISNLKSQLMRDEGIRLKPYEDAMGKLTIGFGRNLTDNGISYGEAESMLDHDLTLATASVLSRIEWSNRLDEVRLSVLINMAFNMGIGGLLTFKKMLAATQRGDYETAAKEMVESTWATQVGPRAHRLATQMATGTWQ